METELPRTLSDWVSLAVQLGVIALAVAGFLWRVLRQPLVETINGLGGRVKIIEEQCSTHSAELDKHDRQIERVEGAVVQNRERFAKLEGMVERLVIAMERNRDAHAEEDSEIRERLVRIETKVDSLHQREGHH